MGYSKAPKVTPPGLGGWTYQGDVALGDPPAGAFYVDQTSMSSGTPTFELNVTDDKGISHLDWLQDLIADNHIVLRNRVRPADALILEISSNTPGAGFQTLVGTITSGNGTFVVGATYDLWEVTTADDFVVGPATSTLNAVPTFSDTTGKVLQDNPTLLYTSGELQLTAATAALEVQERAAAPTFAADKGHVWVRDGLPQLVFTDDIGDDHRLGEPNSVLLGEWIFGGALGITPVGEFETSPTSPLTSITAIRFNANPVTGTGQPITAWAALLPQEGILYFQDVTDPGGTSVTFPYTSITFPLGALWPQFNGAVLSTNGTVHGTNWSANNYSVQIIAVPATLDKTVNSANSDIAVDVPSADPIIFRDNAVNFTPLTIIGTNTTADTPALQVERANNNVSIFKIVAPITDLSVEAYNIRPAANVSSNLTFSTKPATTASGAHHGVDVVLSGGDHSGSANGGYLVLGSQIGSGTAGTIAIGDIAEEIIIGNTDAPGFTIHTQSDHPVAPVATKAQLWVKDDYESPLVTGDASEHVRDGMGLMMTDDTGLDINLSWLASNYKTLLGPTFATSTMEEQGIYAGGTAKVVADASVSYCYDWLSNMWYQSWIDQGTGDAQVTSSADGGYTWETAHEVDTAITTGDLAQPCTNGTNLGVAADGAFYLSTSLSSSDLPAAGFPTGSPASMTGSTGLVWSEQANLWVMCGDNAAGAGYVYTSPTGTTWTNRSHANMSTRQCVSMDIAHVGYGGYLGTERIMISCGSFSNDTFYSTNGGVTWTHDTTGNPTVGLETIQWWPSVGQAVNSSQPGVWAGVDATGNLYISTASQGLDWFDTTIGANVIFRTEEFAGFTNTSTNATWFLASSGSDFVTSGSIGYNTFGVTWSGARPLFNCYTFPNRARYQWGNGVVMWDRNGDAELVIGRYGPIKK